MIKPNIEFDAMILQADNAITSLSPEQTREKLKSEKTLLVDIRDVRELEKEGRIPGSKHVPRGMLEFWMHPQSPYFRQYFGDAQEIILHCNKGWRSALAGKAMQELGIEVSHMSGGYTDWAEKGLPTESYVRK